MKVNMSRPTNTKIHSTPDAYCSMGCKQPYNLTDTESETYSAETQLLCVLPSLCFYTAKMELNEMNILNALQKAEFTDADWELLGQQLMIKQASLSTIRANRHRYANFCIIDTISKWLRTDTEASWEKLAKAVAEVKGYGKATADRVRQEAGIGKLRTDF